MLKRIPDPSKELETVREADRKMNEYEIKRYIDEETKGILFPARIAEHYAVAGQTVITTGFELEDILPRVLSLAVFTMTRGALWENLGNDKVSSLKTWWEWWNEDYIKRGYAGAPRSLALLNQLDRIYYHQHFRLRKPTDYQLIEAVNSMDKLDKISRDFVRTPNHDEWLTFAAEHDLGVVQYIAAQADELYKQNRDLDLTLTVNEVERYIRSKESKPKQTISDAVKASRLLMPFRGRAKGNQYLKIIDTEYLEEDLYRLTIRVQDKKD